MRLAVLLVLAVALLKYHPLLDADGSYPGHDWYDIHQADAEHVARARAEGSWIPFWSPFIQGGTALFAVPTKPLAYPPFLVAVWTLGPRLGMNLLTLAHVLLGAWGMLWLMRKLGVSPWGGAVAAILFITATYPGSLFRSQPFWGYALAWWPWTLAAAHAVLAGEKPRRAGLLLGLLLAVQLLAGGLFLVYWLACFLALFALPYVLRKGAAPRVGALLVAALFVAGLAAVKLLPARQWLVTSGRGEPLTHEEIFFSYEEMAPFDMGHPALTVLRATLVEGDRQAVLALGLLCLLGVVLARGRLALACLLGTLGCLVIATGLMHDQLYEWLPGYDRMRMPYRFLFPASLGAVVLAGLGADKLPRWLGALAVVALLWDASLLPGIRYQAPPQADIPERQAMADPVLDAMDDGGWSRLHYPRAKDQPLWIARDLRATTGVLGGGGSENAAYAAWLPQDAPPIELERSQRGVMDVLGVRWIASFVPLELPWLAPVYATPGQEAPTDAFVARVSADGRELLSSGYLGGTGTEVGYGVAVGRDGRVRVAGLTQSPERQGFAGVADAFVDDALVGGAGEDWARDLALDAEGRAWITGRTGSAALPREPGRPPPSYDAFVASVPGENGPVTPLFFGPRAGEATFTLQDAGTLVALQPGAFSLLRPTAPAEDAPSYDGVRVELGGAALTPLQGREPRRARLHRLVGEPASWVRDVQSWGEVVQASAWPGTDVVFTSRQGSLGLAFVGELDSVQLEFVGSQRVAVDREGRLVVGTTGEPLVFTRPTGADWKVTGLSARLEGDAPTSSTELLMSGGFLGGASADYGKTIAVDGWGDVYVGGYTFSFALPVPGLRRKDSDAFVAKLDGKSGELLWWTLIGGADGDYAQGLAIDPTGRAHVIGSTRSADLPVVGGASRFGGVEDAWVARLSPDGSALEACAFLGGAEGDYGQGIALDAQGRAWIAGDTKSDEHSFPVQVGPDLTLNGKADAFVGRLSGDGMQVEILGYVGGDDIDVGYDVALDPAGLAVIAGVTNSSAASFPLQVGPDLTPNGDWDGFVAKVSQDGQRLLFCGYIGGANIDSANALVVDGAGEVLVAGTTLSSEASFPVTDGTTLARDLYQEYLTRAGNRPYARPMVYRRAGARERACLVEHPVLVVGEPEARQAAIRAALGRRSYAADQVVYVEAASVPSGEGCSAVVFAGRTVDDPDVVAFAAREGGTLGTREGMGALWEPGTPRPTSLVALEPARLDARMDRMSLDLHGLPGSWLLLADTLALHPGWSATIDGQPAPLRCADGLVTAVRLPPGSRRVELAYRTPGLGLGALVSALALLLWIWRWRAAP